MLSSHELGCFRQALGRRQVRLVDELEQLGCSSDATYG